MSAGLYKRSYPDSVRMVFYIRLSHNSASGIVQPGLFYSVSSSVPLILRSSSPKDCKSDFIFNLFIGLTHSHTMTPFDALKFIAVENIVRKGEIACIKQFLLFSQCFLPYMTLIFTFNAL